jgi:hypothetical protein
MPAEKRERSRKAIKMVLWSIIPAFIVAAINSASKTGSFQTSFGMVIIILAVFLAAYVATYFYPYKTRKYSLTNEILTVEKGERQKTYRWEEFSSFFNASSHSYSPDENPQDAGQADDNSLAQVLDTARGSIFYLVFKPKNLYYRIFQNVLVIYTEPDNSRQVRQVLSKKLAETETCGVGLMRYHFK